MTDSAKIREALIEAVGIHEGWEESAIALVDEAIMPIISAILPLPGEDEAVERLTEALEQAFLDWKPKTKEITPHAFLTSWFPTSEYLARAAYAALKKLAEEQR